MYPCNLSALPIKTNGAFPLLCCDKIEHNEWHLESAKLQAASRSYHVLLLQCHLLTFFTKQNVYLICSFLRMHLLKSRSPGGGVAWPGYIYIYRWVFWHFEQIDIESETWGIPWNSKGTDLMGGKKTTIRIHPLWIRSWKGTFFLDGWVSWNPMILCNSQLGGETSPILGEMIQFD